MFNRILQWFLPPPSPPKKHDLANEVWTRVVCLELKYEDIMQLNADELITQYTARGMPPEEAKYTIHLSFIEATAWLSKVKARQDRLLSIVLDTVPDQEHGGLINYYFRDLKVLKDHNLLRADFVNHQDSVISDFINNLYTRTELKMLLTAIIKHNTLLR